MTDFQLGDDLPGHPSSEELAAYVNGTLGAAGREPLEAHLLTCRECRRDVTSARQILRRHRTRARAWTVAPLAVAAVLVFMVISRTWLSDATIDEQLRGTGAGATRSDTAASIQIVQPRNNATIEASAVTFVWRGEANRPLYKLSLTDVSGAEVWSVETVDTTIALPASISLDRGRSYYWTVDALGADGRSLTTRTQTFMVR